MFDTNLQPVFAPVKIKVNEVEDESHLFQFGKVNAFKYMDLEFGPNEFSAFTDYPNSYKFISVDFQLTLDTLLIDRQTIGILDLIGDVGGLIEFLVIVLGVLAYKFSEARLNGLITNRIYHITPNSEIVKSVLQKPNSKTLITRPNGEIEVGVPVWLDWRLLRQMICCN